MTTEKRLEKKLREAVKKMGGQALKLYSMSVTGLPDRMVLMPGGRIWFVELKSEGAKPTPSQESFHKKLRGLGFWVEVISTDEQLQDFLNHLNKISK